VLLAITVYLASFVVIHDNVALAAGAEVSDPDAPVRLMAPSAERFAASDRRRRHPVAWMTS